MVDQYSGLELDIPIGDEEHTLGEAILLGNVVISQIFLCTCKIMVMV